MQFEIPINVWTFVVTFVVSAIIWNRGMILYDKAEKQKHPGVAAVGIVVLGVVLTFGSVIGGAICIKQDQMDSRRLALEEGLGDPLWIALYDELTEVNGNSHKSNNHRKMLIEKFCEVYAGRIPDLDIAGYEYFSNIGSRGVILLEEYVIVKFKGALANE